MPLDAIAIVGLACVGVALLIAGGIAAIIERRHGSIRQAGGLVVRRATDASGRAVARVGFGRIWAGLVLVLLAYIAIRLT